MKWILYLMLLANVGFLYWQTSHPPTESARPVEAASRGITNRLLLLSEVDSEKLRDRAASGPGTDGDNPVCFSVGPFTDPSGMKDVAAWIDDRGGSATEQRDQRREVRSHWVHFPPFPTRAEALARVKKMESDGIKDLIMIYRGDMERAVSAGVFRWPSAANRRAAFLESKGYAANVGDLYRTVTGTWLDVSFEDEPFPVEEFRDAFTKLDVAETQCG